MRFREAPSYEASGWKARMGSWPERCRCGAPHVASLPRSRDCVAIDLCRVVDEVVDELAPLLRGLGIEIRHRPAEAPVFVVTVPSTLARCVASSLIAFTPETEVEINVEHGDRPAVILTARRGAFESRPLATEAVRRTLASFGGSLVMSSDGEGATMRLELVPADPPAVPREASWVAASPKRLRVLVIDDEALLLRVTSRLLPDYDVTTTTSARKGLDQLGSGRFDVLLCDFQMPEMRGDAVLASAIALGFDPAHFVMMTGGNVEEIESAVGERRPIVLAKPYTRKELEGAIGRTTSR